MNETRFSHVATFVRSIQRRALLPAILLGSLSVLLLSGCSSGLNFANAGNGSPESVQINGFKGAVHGGQAAIDGSAVCLFDIGDTSGDAAGYAAAISPAPSTCTGSNTPSGQLLAAATSSGSGGSWSMAGPINCTAGDELYFVAIGGYPYQSAANSNSALVMTSVAGPCGSQFSSAFDIDEVSTVVTEYALSGFASDYQHLGTSTTNTLGLTNAFATVNNLISLSSGLPYTNTPAYNTPPTNATPDVFSSIVGYDLINTLGNVLSLCVNGAAPGGGGTPSQCSTLFSYLGSGANAYTGAGVRGPSTVANTADAALYIAHNPGLPGTSGTGGANNVAAVWMMTPPTGAPFGPVLTAAPNDFTLTVNYVGGGLGGTANTSDAGGTQMAIDLDGNVWVVDSTAKAVTKLSPLGAPISASTQINNGGSYSSGAGSGALIAHGGYALTSASELGTPSLAGTRIDTDQNGDAWVADEENCLWGLSSSGAQLSGSPFTSSCPASASPKAVTVDSSNNLYVSGTTFVTSLNNPAGTVRTGFPVTGSFTNLGAYLAPDEASPSNIWWLDDGSAKVGYVTGAGVNTPEYTGLPTPGAYAAVGTGSAGLELWMGSPTNDGIYPLPMVSPFTDETYGYFSGDDEEYGLAEFQADGNDRYFWSAVGSSVESIPDNIAEFLPNETQISGGTSAGQTGFQGGSATGPASVVLLSPEGFVIDQAGNAWVVNASNYNVENGTGPYAGEYISTATGVNATNVTEFIGLAGPTQPVPSLNAKNSTYGVKP